MNDPSEDGSRLIRAFERLAVEGDASAERALEAAAMGIALASLGLLDRAIDRERVASRARRVLLGVGAMRASVEDEDARDALDLAIEQARRGAAVLGGASLAALDGPRCTEPTAADVGKLLRGALDGHAAADVALRLHRSGAREKLSALLPDRAEPVRMRLAADSAPGMRDPSQGRLVGTSRLDPVALEAYAFSDGVVAIYAEPAIAITITSSDAPIAGRVIEASGYLELRFEDDPSEATLLLGDGTGERSVRWSLRLR